MAYVVSESKEFQKGYLENLQLLQGAADELVAHMKGHDFSFKQEITDEKGHFSQEKLQGLVEEMLSCWERYHRANLFPAYTDAGLQERRELYKLYLYLVMRCSLEKGAYSDARNGAKLKERTDFAFLLKQAGRLVQEWYAEPGPDGGLRNEVYGGYDDCFGLHLYYALHDPDVLNDIVNSGNDYALTPDWKVTQALDRALSRGAERPQVEEEPEETPPAGEDHYVFDEHDYDSLDEEEVWDFLDAQSNYAYLEEMAEKEERAIRLGQLARQFECPEEYRAACERFVKLFTEAPPEVPRDFCADLEKMVDLYLVKRGVPPLMNRDKTLEVYNNLCDGALRQAARYGRGIQWKGL